jgi:hypothetical protein
MAFMVVVVVVVMVIMFGFLFFFLVACSLCFGIKGYQKKVFAWHCQEIYPFDKFLSGKEMEYVTRCIDISWWEIFRIFYLLNDPIVPRLSFFSFSQKIKNQTVNQSRMAYGSTVRPDLIEKEALSVMNERNIKPPFYREDKNIMFYGLGWDFKKKHFKIYCRFKDFDLLEKKYRDLVPSSINQNQNQNQNQNKKQCEGETEGYLRSGLVSWTYYFPSGKMIETKIYRYSKNGKETDLYSDQRKEKQIDCFYGNVKKNQKNWSKRVNSTGKNIISKYQENGYLLDTIAFKNKNEFSLYFPKAF